VTVPANSKAFGEGKLSMSSVAGENRRSLDARDISTALAPSLGRVVENLESLRELIGAISAAEISAAESKAAQLQSYLVNLQEHLRKMAEVKIKLAKVHQLRGQNQKESVRKKPPANNLILFPIAAKRRESAEARRSDLSQPLAHVAKRASALALAEPALDEGETQPAPAGTAEKRLPESAPARPEAATAGVAKPALEFDQDLLEELIKDYGEFESLSNPALAERENEREAVAAAPSKPVPAEEPVSASPPRAPRGQLPHAANFDRAVRELVMSYGQVDLYATSDRTRLLKKVIAAGAVLAAVGLGCYLFLAPGSGPARQISTPAEPVATSPLPAGGQPLPLLPAEPAAGPKRR
jgi:hypothetical protein